MSLLRYFISCGNVTDAHVELDIQAKVRRLKEELDAARKESDDMRGFQAQCESFRAECRALQVYFLYSVLSSLVLLPDVLSFCLHVCWLRPQVWWWMLQKFHSCMVHGFLASVLCNPKSCAAPHWRVCLDSLPGCAVHLLLFSFR